MQPRRLLVLVSLVGLITLVRAIEEPVAQPTDVDSSAGAGPVDAEASIEAVEVEPDPEELSEPEAAEEEAVVDDGSDREARAGAASVQWVVTQKMRSQLSKLGYSEAEIGVLDPERAAAIIRRSITRPQKGVPSGWNRGVASKPQPIRAAVGMGRSLLEAVAKPMRAAPGGPIAPLVAVAAAGAVGFGLVPFGAGSAAVVERVLAPDPDEFEPELVEDSGSDELWLDRQIDKFIDFLKGLLGK